MNIVQLKAAFQTSIDLLPELQSYHMDDEFNINAGKDNQYPLVWMAIPDSKKLFNFTHGDGYEEFTVPFTIFDKQNDMTLTEQLARLADIEVLANKVFRGLPTANTDILGYGTDADTIRANRLHNDNLLGVRIALVLTVFTGWDCL